MVCCLLMDVRPSPKTTTYRFFIVYGLDVEFDVLVLFISSERLKKRGIFTK